MRQREMEKINESLGGRDMTEKFLPALQRAFDANTGICDTVEGACDLVYVRIHAEENTITLDGEFKPEEIYALWQFTQAQRP